MAKHHTIFEIRSALDDVGLASHGKGKSLDVLQDTLTELNDWRQRDFDKRRTIDNMIESVHNAAINRECAERLCLKLHERLNWYASEPLTPEDCERGHCSVPECKAAWAKWDAWNAQAPAGLTDDEQKAIEAMRWRQKA